MYPNNGYFALSLQSQCVANDISFRIYIGVPSRFPTPFFLPFRLKLFQSRSLILRHTVVIISIGRGNPILLRLFYEGSDIVNMLSMQNMYGETISLQHGGKIRQIRHTQEVKELWFIDILIRFHRHIVLQRQAVPFQDYFTLDAINAFVSEG